jgi:hypothetical protein
MTAPQRHRFASSSSQTCFQTFFSLSLSMATGASLPAAKTSFAFSTIAPVPTACMANQLGHGKHQGAGCATDAVVTTSLRPSLSRERRRSFLFPRRFFGSFGADRGPLRKRLSARPICRSRYFSRPFGETATAGGRMPPIPPWVAAACQTVQPWTAKFAQIQPAIRDDLASQRKSRAEG